MRTAIVYDRVNKWGGAEKVLLELHKIYPKAPLFTSVYDPVKATWAKVFPNIYTSFIQKIPFAKSNHEFFATLMPLAFELFNFDDYDLVISVTSESAKGIITKPNTLHVSYILTPTRYLWSQNDFYFKNALLKLLSLPVVYYLRTWDKIAAQRPDIIYSISSDVQKRVKKYYNRDSEIIFPPVNLKSKKLGINRKNYYLYVGRLVPYKRVDILVDAFNKLGKQLIIVGGGSERSRLEMKGKKNIKFVGEISEKELIKYYSEAKALLMPQEEDFGIVSIEAQSYGLPVVAFGKGGSLDTVIDGKTGMLFDEQSVESLLDAIEKFEKMSFNDKLLVSNARRFQGSFIRFDRGWRGRHPTLAGVPK